MTAMLLQPATINHKQPDAFVTEWVHAKTVLCDS